MSASVLREPVATKTVQVRYLRQEEKLQSRDLYEEMFPEDEESFVDAYYKIKGACNRILVLEEGGELRSMLHLNPYRFWMRGKSWNAVILWRWPPGLCIAIRAICGAFL